MASSPFVLGSSNTASLRWPQYSRPPPLCQASIEFPGDTTGRCRVRAFVPLGSNFESFQHRKRETGIEKLSFEDIISQLKQEDLIKQRTANIALTTRARNTCQKCQKPGHSEDDCWKDITCKYCKKKGHPEDRCHKKKENQDQGSAVAGSAVICA